MLWGGRTSTKSLSESGCFRAFDLRVATEVIRAIMVEDSPCLLHALWEEVPLWV